MKKGVIKFKLVYNQRLLFIIILFIIMLGTTIYLIIYNQNTSIKSENICITDSDCVPSSCCHANSCVNISNKPNCNNTFCTMNCESTLDCEAKCSCINNKCGIEMKK